MGPALETGSSHTTPSVMSNSTTSATSTPSTPRTGQHPTILNLPSTPSDFGEGESGPSTPMSCVSTIAIKDGHEGHRPGMSGFDGAAERISRLSAISAGGYFDVNKRPDTPASMGGRAMQTDSPASTDSAREHRKEARLIDGMTYDEGVVDTTDKTPPAVVDERC